MSDQEVLLAVDIGTSAARALLFDTSAHLIATVRQVYDILHPQPGWSEQDPDTVTQAVIQVLREAVAALPIEKRLAGVVFSSQMYSILAMDRAGRPLSNSLTWGDTRSADVAADLQDTVGARLIKHTGCPLQAIYPLAKILWLRKDFRLPQDVIFVSIKDYVLWRLTGQLITDWSVASASGLLDITQQTWHDEALQIAGITRANLPETVSPRHITRKWRREILQQTDIAPDTPLIMGAGDAPLANIGVGAISPGALAVNVGTSAAARVLISRPQIDTRGRLWTYIADESQWVTGGIIGGGGAVYDWLLKTLLISDDEHNSEYLYSEADRLAADVLPGADGLFFVPYFAGEQSPSWNPAARGLIYGIDFRHERKHHIRAALEGLTFALLRVADTIAEVRGGNATKLYLTGGLTSSPIWLSMIANIFGVPVVVPRSSEGSARGAAILGWIALGYADEYAAFHHSSEPEDILTPQPEIHATYKQIYQTFCSLNEHLQTFSISQEAKQ